jgi:hypothetical protein
LHQQINQTNHMQVKTFTHIKALEKQDARLFVRDNYRGGKVLTLSADNFYFENLLLDKLNNKQSIDCYEYEQKHYLNGKKLFAQVKKRNQNMRYIFDNIFNADFTQYDFIFLDLCCNLSVETTMNIIASLQGFKGQIFITLMRTREKFTNEDLNAYGVPKKKCIKERKRIFRDTTFVQLVEQFTNLKQFAPRYDYQNTFVKKGETKVSRGTPMAIYSFTKK